MTKDEIQEATNRWVRNTYASRPMTRGYYSKDQKRQREVIEQSTKFTLETCLEHRYYEETYPRIHIEGWDAKGRYVGEVDVIDGYDLIQLIHDIINAE